MSTTIDSLQIEIQTSSTNASQGIDNLAEALGRLKANSALTTPVNNLNKLKTALDGLKTSSSNATKIRELALAMEKLSGVGSIPSLSGLSKLPDVFKGLDGIDVNGGGEKLKELAEALAPLSQVNTSGFTSTINSLLKIDKVVANLDEAKLKEFETRVRRISDALTPLSRKLVTVSDGLKGFTAASRATGSSAKNMGSGINVATLNLHTFIHVAHAALKVVTKIAQGFKNVISQAIEWDGVAARFGRGFGESADETYAWAQKLNEQMGINTQEFMQYSSIYATMLTGFGVASEDASKMAVGYMELTYDLWAGANDQYKRLEDAADAIKSAIAGEVEPIRKAGMTITEATLKETAANHGLKVSLENATEAQKSYLRYLAITDSAYGQNLVGTYARELNTAEGAIRTLSQQVKSLAQAIGSLFLPILVAVVPWIQAFVNLAREAVVTLAGFFGIEIQPVSWGDGLDTVTDSATTATDAVGETAQAMKDLKNATLGIDELNVINPNSGSGSGGGTGGSGGFDGVDVNSLWDQATFDSIQSQVAEIENQIREALSSITSVASGFMLAIGLLLVLTNANVPLGLGLIASGAVGLASVIAANWDGMSTKLAETLTTVTSVLGGFLLAIGAFLVFTGASVGLGAGLMVAGATSLGTAVTINWKFLEGDMKNSLSIIMGVVSGGLLAIGALFAFTGAATGLGIGLMIAGATGLASTVGLNWDAMTEPVKKAVGTLTGILGGALLTFGSILAFSGANIPLGIGLMASGAVSLATAATLNWDSLTGDIKTRVATITAIVSGALIGIGAILAFTGVALPLGVALIAAGAVGIVSTAAVNWKTITNKVSNFLSEFGAILGGSLLVIGAILTFTGVALPLGLGLMAAGGASLGTAISLNWNALINKMKEAWNKIKIWWENLKSLDPVDILVKLLKFGWTTIKAFLGVIPGVSIAVKLLKSGWSSVKNWIGSVPAIQAGIKLVKNGWSSIKSWLGNLNFDLGFKLPKIGVKWGEKTVLGFKITFPSGFYTYAQGGFPDMGELFVAREAGPEMVGRIGNKTTVANNDQIVEGISAGVYEAVMAAMKASGGEGGSQSVNVYLDGKQITTAVEQRQRERGATIMGNQVYSY